MTELIFADQAEPYKVYLVTTEKGLKFNARLSDAGESFIWIATGKKYPLCWTGGICWDSSDPVEFCQIIERFNPFPKLDCKYGCQMGRQSTRNGFCGVPADKLCVSHPQGEYDSGHAYWGSGMGEGSVYAVWERGKGHKGVMYVRAHSKQDAIKAVMEG
jgi:hypothetical protein